MKYYKVQEVDSQEDLKLLNEVLDQIVDKACWRSQIVGGLLRLDIGGMIPNGDDAGKSHGEWEFEAIYSGWELVQHSMILVASSDEYGSVKIITDEVLKKIKAVEGTKITSYEVNHADLSLDLGFSGGYKLRIYPGSGGGQKDAFWELFTPDDMILDAGPGETYFYTCAGVAGMDPWEMLEFHDFLENERRQGNGGTLTPDGDYTMEELMEKSEEFRELYPGSDSEPVGK